MLQRACKKISVKFLILILLSSAMDTDDLDFWRLVGFIGGWFFSFTTWLILFIFEDVTFVLVIYVISSRRSSITLSICTTSFTLFFYFANFVNCWLLSNLMRCIAIDTKVLRRSSFLFRNFVEFRTFTWTATFTFTRVASEQCSSDIAFLF